MQKGIDWLMTLPQSSQTNKQTITKTLFSSSCPQEASLTHWVSEVMEPQRSVTSESITKVTLCYFYVTLMLCYFYVMYELKLTASGVKWLLCSLRQGKQALEQCLLRSPGPKNNYDPILKLFVYSFIPFQIWCLLFWNSVLLLPRLVSGSQSSCLSLWRRGASSSSATM